MWAQRNATTSSSGPTLQQIQQMQQQQEELERNEVRILKLDWMLSVSSFFLYHPVAMYMNL